jgi:hypothetical protein
MVLDYPSEFEQHIYNTHLKISRRERNLPFKFRKDFDDIDPIVLKNLKKLSYFFGKHNHINVEEFFIAPFRIYLDEKFFDLEYFTTLKAVKSYTVYQNKKLTLLPDSGEQLNNILNSLKFISEFCTENDIAIENYVDHKTNNTYSFLLHLKEHKINVYSLFGFKNFDKNLKSVAPDILSFIIGNEVQGAIPNLRVKYFQSTKAKRLVELGLQKIIKNKLD